MKVHKAGIRYGKALLDLAVEQKKEDMVLSDMQLMKSVLEENRDLTLMLKSPIIRQDKKVNIIKAIFEGHISDLGMMFITILAKKQREELLEDICDSFISQYNREKNIVIAELTTAFPIDEGIRKAITGLAKKIDNSNIDLREAVDEDIIGGFQLKVGDKRIDESVERKLNDYKREFSQNPYIKSL